MLCAISELLLNSVSFVLIIISQVFYPKGKSLNVKRFKKCTFTLHYIKYSLLFGLVCRWQNITAGFHHILTVTTLYLVLYKIASVEFFYLLLF